MKKLFLLFTMLGVVTFLHGKEKIDPMKLSAADFLKIVRHVPGQETWAKMEGSASHKREGARRIKAPIRLGIRFTPARIVAQMVFDSKEFYDLGQSFDPPVSTQDMRVPEGHKPKLPLYGIDISDLTLGFLYQDLVREEKPQSVKTLSCRVFVLKGAKDGEVARVFISTDYFFPMKVQWYRADPGGNVEGTPWRALEIASVKKAPDSDFYLIPKLEISGPDWSTMINFDKRFAGYAKDGMPEDLFLFPED